MDHLNTCGCKSCGGPEARANAILARRVMNYTKFIAATRGADLANRNIRPGLYERLLMGVPA